MFTETPDVSKNKLISESNFNSNTGSINKIIQANLQLKNSNFKFSSSNNIIGNNISNFININNSSKIDNKNNIINTIGNNLNNHYLSNPSLVHGIVKNAFSLEKKNGNSNKKMTKNSNKRINTLTNSLGHKNKINCLVIKKEEKGENLKDRSNVLSDQIKKITNKIMTNELNNFSLSNKGNKYDSKKLINYHLFENELKNRAKLLNESQNNKIKYLLNIPNPNNNLKKTLNINNSHPSIKYEQDKLPKNDLLLLKYKINKLEKKIIPETQVKKDKICKNIENSIIHINELKTHSTGENEAFIEKNKNYQQKLKLSDINNENKFPLKGNNQIDQIRKSIKSNNISTDNNMKEKCYVYSLTKHSNHPSNNNNSVIKTKHSKNIDDEFLNSNNSIIDNSNNYLKNIKSKPVSLTTNKLNSSIKSLTNDSNFSNTNKFEEQNSIILENFKEIIDNHNILDDNKNHFKFKVNKKSNFTSGISDNISSKLDEKQKETDSLIKKHESEGFPDANKIIFNSPNNKPKIHNIKADSSFSSNNKYSSNNKQLLQLSYNTQMNPIDTDINIIENNRDKDREKDRLMINEIFNEEPKQVNNPLSADNHFTKMSDRTHDHYSNKKSYLEKIALKNIGYKNTLNINKKIKEKNSNLNDLKYSNLFLNNLHNIKNKLPIGNNIKFINGKVFNNKNDKEKNSNIRVDTKIPYIQVRKYITKYLNEKNEKKPMNINNKIHDSLENMDLNTIKVLHTDPNENLEKVKNNLLKNLNLNIGLNEENNSHFNGNQKNLNTVNYIEEQNVIDTENIMCQTNNHKTIMTDNQLYEFDENHDINNPTSERLSYNQNLTDVNQNEGFFIKKNFEKLILPKENKGYNENLTLKDKFNSSFPRKVETKLKENINNGKQNQDTVLYLSVIEFINKNFKSFEIIEIIKKFRNDAIFYLGHLNAKFQIFYSKIDLIKIYIESALQKRELNIYPSSLFIVLNKDYPNNESRRSYNTKSSDSKNNEATNYENYQNEKIIDDENGNYIVRIGDHIDYRYEIISELGQGSFGQALKCFDHKFKEFVCVKIIKNKKKFIKQSKIEIGLLEYIKKNDTQDQKNIVRILDNFSFRNHNVYQTKIDK